MRAKDFFGELDPVELATGLDFAYYREASAMVDSGSDDETMISDIDKELKVVAQEFPTLHAIGSILCKDALENGRSEDFSAGMYTGAMELAHMLWEHDAKIALQAMFGDSGEQGQPS